MEIRRLVIGNDHTGVALKNELVKYLTDKGYEVLNVGTDSPESYPYPVAGYRIAKAVVEGKADAGIAICGTGIGISLACNKVDGIRCAVCSEPYSAKLSRMHNNSNIIAFGARVVGPEMAKMIVDEWLGAEFQGGRHQKRVDMVMEIQDTQHLKEADEN